MNESSIHLDTYFHIRVILGMVTSLAITRLLTGLARFMQHPGRVHVYSLHIGWVVFLLLEVQRFWWFEYTLASVTEWNFARYAFVTGYAALHFFLATMLFPDDMSEFNGYKGYMEARRGWFFGLVAALLTVDLIDTLLKGQEYYSHLALAFPAPEIVLITGAIIAAKINNKTYNQLYLLLCLTTQILLIVFRTGSF